MLRAMRPLLLLPLLCLAACRTPEAARSGPAPEPLPGPAILRSAPLLDGAAPLPADVADRDLVLGFAAAGGPHRPLFLRVPWTGGAVPMRTEKGEDGVERRVPDVEIRCWQQQRDLQPSQIRRQVRELRRLELRRGADGVVQGGLDLRIATPKQAGQPAIEEVVTLAFAFAPSAGPAPDLRPERSTPPWRRLDIPLCGPLIAGEATGTRTTARDGGAPASEPLRLAAWGVDRPAARAGGPWTMAGDGTLAVSTAGDGVRFAAGLATVPTDAGEGVTATLMLPARIDATWANALLVEYTAPAAPATFDVRVEESPGLWYGHAFPCAGGRRTAVIPFAHLGKRGGFDMDYHFTPTAIGGIAVAIGSGHGAGAVDVVVHRVAAVLADGNGFDGRPWLRAPERPVRVTVATDAVRRVNGSGDVPEGLFGVHAVGVPKADAPAVAALRASGVRALRTIEERGFAPFDQPPRRAEIPGLLPLLPAGVADELIECWAHGLLSTPPWAKEGVPAFAARIRAFGASLAGHAWSPAHPERTLRRTEFLNEPFMWARHVNRPDSALTDPTQHGHLPMRLCTDVYITLFNAATEGAAEVNPHLQWGGPSSAAFASDDWRHLEHHVLPVVAGCPRLAFVTEHHYEGRAPQYAAEYDVFQAAVAPLGRRVPIVNTECNDLSDTPGAWEKPLDFAPAGASRRRAAYQLGEILAHLRHGPDHARFRAVHALWSGEFRKRGEAAAFRLLAGLRGRLVPLAVDDAAVLAAAARDGDAGCVVVYNDGPYPRRLELPGLAPYARAIRRLGFDPATDVTESDAAPVAADRAGEAIVVELAPLAAVAVDLAGLPALRGERRETVRYARAGARGALWRVAPGGRLDLAIPDAPAAAPAALRVVAEGLAAGEAVVRLGAVTIPLPASGQHLDVAVVPLPPGADVRAPRIEVLPGGDGFRLAALSALWVEEAPVEWGR